MAGMWLLIQDSPIAEDPSMEAQRERPSEEEAESQAETM